MKVRIQRIKKDIEMVKYAHDGDAAFDLRSSEDMELSAGGKIIVPVIKVKEAPKSKTDNSQKQKAAQEDNKKEVEKKEKSEK